MTIVPATRPLPQLGPRFGEEVVGDRRLDGGALVRTAVGTAEVNAGFCPRETAAGGDPAQPATANSSRIVAQRGRQCTAPASLPCAGLSAIRAMISGLPDGTSWKRAPLIPAPRSVSGYRNAVEAPS